MEKIFVIGDIHACLNTLNELLEHWNKDTEQLIFVGDLIDRGNFSPETVSLVKKLVKNEDAVCLMGNHEYACARAILEKNELSWFRKMGDETVLQYKKAGIKIKNDAKWFMSLPLIWQNGNIIISHAGISKKVLNPFEKNDGEGVLWTRSELKLYENKIQIHGHTPHFDNPSYNDKTNSWNIDSACVYDYFLTGIKFDISGKFIEKIRIPTNQKDIPKKYDLSE